MATAENTNVVQFPTPTSSWSAPTEIRLYSSSSGGNLIAKRALSSTVSAPAIGSDVEIPAGGFDISMPATADLPAHGTRKCVDGLISGTMYFALATSSGELSGGSYARVAIAASAWTVNT